MNEDRRLSIVLGTVRGVLPPVLASEGLDDFQDYLDDTPSDVNRRQFAIWHAEGSETITRESVAFLMRAQLPGVTNPRGYLSAIWPALRSALNPSIIDMIDREISYIVWYPGEGPGTGQSSFIDMEVRFSRNLDDKEED